MAPLARPLLLSPSVSLKGLKEAPGRGFLFLQTNHSMHCSSFMVGVLCLSINLHEAGRIEAGGCGKPTSH